MRRHEHASPGLRRARRVALHDPGQRDRRRVRRGDRPSCRPSSHCSRSTIRSSRSSWSTTDRETDTLDRLHRGLRPRALPGLRPARLPDGAGARDLPQRRPPEPRRRRQGERRQGGCAERGPQRRALPVRLRRRRGHGLRPRRRSSRACAVVVEDPARDHRRDEPPHDRAGPERVHGGASRPPPDRPAAVHRRYQHLDYLRAFFNNRLAWSRLGLHALRRRRLPDLAS